MKRLGSLALVVVALFLLGACAQKVTTPYAPVAPQDLSGKVASGEYAAKVENFVLLLDASSSMARPYTVGTRFETAKGLTEALSETLPELSWQAGLRFFGPRFEGYDQGEPRRLQTIGHYRKLIGPVRAGYRGPRA